MTLAVEGQDLQGTYWIWEARSLCTHWLLCLLGTSPGPGVQSQKNKDKCHFPVRALWVVREGQN